MDLNGKVAVITGAGRGIGQDIAVNLAREGCRVALVGRTLSALEATGAKCAAFGEALVLALDLSRLGDCKKAIPETLKSFGTVDILINNAAMITKTPYLDVPDEEWELAMNTNVRSAFKLSQDALKVMKAKGAGYIINISSTVALGVPKYHTTYGVSKHAMVGLSEALWENAKEHGVKVSTIFPGMTDTPMLRSCEPSVAEENWMQPQDISDCVLFLLKLSERVIVKELVPWAARHDQI